MMITVYFLTITSTIAYVVRVLELPLLQAQNTQSFAALYLYFNAFYMTFITITTVGYGDITPQTRQGRVLMMIATLVGTLLISMIVLASTTYLNLDKKQDVAFRQIKASYAGREVILKAFRFYRLKKQFYAEKIMVDPESVKNS